MVAKRDRLTYVLMKISKLNERSYRLKTAIKMNKKQDATHEDELVGVLAKIAELKAERTFLQILPPISTRYKSHLFDHDGNVIDTKVYEGLAQCIKARTKIIRKMNCGNCFPNHIGLRTRDFEVTKDSLHSRKGQKP